MNRMSRASATRDTWRPQTKQDRDAVLRELHDILASPHFVNSKRYPALLQYIVENTLAGKSELLKERTLGVEVFDRPPTYDTNTDTVVRYTAGEVRKRLSLYYHEHGRDSSIRISLPAGSYIPEFLHGNEVVEDLADQPATSIADGRVYAEPNGETWDQENASLSTLAVRNPATETVSTSPARHRLFGTRILWLALAALIVIAAIAAMRLRDRVIHPQTAVDEFWAPVLHDQHSVLICAGSIVFAPERFSGTLTAGKDIEYPFVSMEGASAISLVSGLVQSSGVTTQLQSAGSTPLTELREHSVILIGGFNNLWTLRLLQPLRFHFSPDPAESIIDRMNPHVQWMRDPALPYSGADDYALVARYRDPTTDSWVIVLAGLGRNGTEAAAQFATSPRYMQSLKDQLGNDFANRNVEAVLRVHVIEGKTGAPSILAVNAQ